MNNKEIPVSFLNGEEKLFGILHVPMNAELSAIPMVIFLHGFAGYRIGPHQLFVRTARFLAQRGYACLRFDFRGRGYSEGKREQTSYQSMVADLDVVIRSVRRTYKPTRIVLLGICSGARTAIYYIKNGKEIVHSLIELSSPLLWQTNEMSTATSETKSVISGYMRKAHNIDNWKRLFVGEVNRRMIGRIVRSSIINYWSAIKRSIITEKKKQARDRKHDEKAFHHFKGDVLLIHGGKDPETDTAMKQIGSLLQKHHVGYRKLVIKNANHSFYSLKWEKEIIDTIYDWLKQTGL